MDWARDNAGLSDKDLKNVFRYEERPTTVVRMLVGEKEPEIWSRSGDEEWDSWLNNECPTIDGSSSGLVLILAKRTGELSIEGVKKVRSDDWLDRLDAEMPERSHTWKTMAFSMNEKAQTISSGRSNTPAPRRRSVRTLPFSQPTFRHITKKFYTHRSIARDISRADIPVFSSSEIEMGEVDAPAYPAYVYNCRTTNAWDMDLALTATYFPHCGMTFAIIFGCPLSVEEEIVKRLSFATAEASHPLLMPGILAELERSRHIHIVEATIDEIETRIFELDFQDRERMPNSESERRNQDKRTAWLDTTYLRNGLVSWNTQLLKIKEHAEELRTTLFKPTTIINPGNFSGDVMKGKEPSTSVEVSHCKTVIFFDKPKLADPPARRHSASGELSTISIIEETRDIPKTTTHNLQKEQTIKTPTFNNEVFKEQMRRLGHKIEDRIQAISDEYDDKIRDCTMRVDGMAMATQWSHGETNVEIALATRRESKHMRSIALVTMVFLPGTFFASVFSMTFFNWQSGAVVSSYIWVYVVVTLFFTLLTVGSWWYLVVYRPSRPLKTHDEEEIPLV